MMSKWDVEAYVSKRFENIIQVYIEHLYKRMNSEAKNGVDVEFFKNYKEDAEFIENWQKLSIDKTTLFLDLNDEREDFHKDENGAYVNDKGEVLF